MKSMTRTRAETYNWIRLFIDEAQRPPSMSELSQAFGLSVHGAGQRVRDLKAMGLLTRSKCVYSIQLTPKEKI